MSKIIHKPFKEKLKAKLNDILFKIFWKTKDEIITNENKTMSLEVVLIPRFGRLGAIVWFFLTDDGKWIIDNGNT